MFSWNFAKSAEEMFSGWAIKRICKFLLKKKLGQLILGEIDLTQLDVQLKNGSFQLSDLALNVDFLNQKFGETAMLAVKDGYIGSLEVKLPWKGRGGCQIEVNQLELVLGPRGAKISQVDSETSTSGQDSNISSSHDQGNIEDENVDSTVATASVDLHEGVKTIAKMVKWLLSSFHVKIKKLIVVFDPSLGEEKNKVLSRTLVLRFSEVECGTDISEDINPDCQASVDRFLGLNRLTNFVKFDGAILEFVQMDSDDIQAPNSCASGTTWGEWYSGCCPSNATTPIIIGEKGGFSGTIKLSIPWKNGSLDIRKVDADVNVDPLELRFQPSSIQCFLYLVDMFKKMGDNRKSGMHNTTTESVYFSAASHILSSTLGSSEFATDKGSRNHESFSDSYSFMGRETVTDALLRGSHLISDWVTSPLSRSQKVGTEEPDFGASVDQFFECFDGLRNSQSALGNSGMWNWTCSVFSAITAASNLASGSLHIPSEQKHVETNLKARIAGIRVLFSLVDGEQKHSCISDGAQKNSTSHVHYMGAEFQDMQLGLQVCPREINFEATVKHIEVADHFSNGYDVRDIGLHGQDDIVKAQVESIRNLQAAVQGACPPFCSVVDDEELAKPRECTAVDVSSNMHSLSICTCRRSCRGIYRDDVVKVILLQTSAVTQAQFTVAYVSSDDTFSGPISFSLKLPPFVFWVNFHLINVTLEFIKQIGNSLGMDSTENRSASEAFPRKCRPSSSQEDGSPSSSPHVTTLPTEGNTLSGNIFLLNARVFLCFPCGKNDDFRSYSSWNQFIVLDFSSPYSLSEKKVRASNPFRNSSPKESYSVTRSLHLNVGNLDIYAIASTSQYNDSFGKLKTKFSAQKVLSIANRAGHPSVIGMFWQEGCVTGPSIVNRAKVLATSDGMSCRHKFMGKGYEFASVTTIKDMEDFNSRTRQKMLFSSAFLLHVQLFPVTVFLDSTQYEALRDLSQQVGDWLTCITSEPVGAKENSSFSQTSVLVECETVEFSLSLKTVESLKGSIQNELPGSWHRLKLKISTFDLLSVSNIGGIKDASFLWASHGEGSLWGSITDVPDQEFLLISCNNSTRGRGGGEGSNILSSRLSGSDIVHLWDPESLQSHVSVNIRCGTIVATGGRLDWLDSLISFFSLSSPETDQVGNDNDQKEDANGGSFILNLIDVGVSYEPYFCKMMVGEHFSDHYSANVNGKLSDQYVAGFLGASSVKISNVMVDDSAERDYMIKVQDLGLLLCTVSGPKKVGGCYSAKHLRKTGYVKVAQEAHVEALLRMNCKNGHLWDVECCDSHVVLDTCQDTASALIRLAAQLQQLFVPDIEESVVHLQTRWDSVQEALETDGATKSTNHFPPSTSQMRTSSVDTCEEAGVINLMDEIREGAFHLDGNWESQSVTSESDLSSPPYDILGETWTFGTVDPESTGLENSPTSSSQTSMTEFIEEYFISDLRPLSELSLNNQSFNENIKTKSRTVKDEARRGNTGWYGDTSLRILENHVLNAGERTNVNQLLEREAPCNQALNDDNEKVKGRVLLKNVDVRWRLYGGSDWQDTQKNVQHASSYGRDKTVCLELALSGIDVQYDTFPDGEVSVSRLSFSIQDFRLYDNSKDAPWKQVLGYYQSKNYPRESSSKALKLDLEAVRPNPSTPLEEYRLRIALHPMRLHLHQCQLDFLISFFGGKGSSNDHSQSSQDQSESGMAKEKKTNPGRYNIIAEALLPYFQKFDIWPVLLRVDYSPSHVDLAALRGGKYVELVNLVPWKGVELQLKHVQAVGVYGWSCVCETIIGEWLEDISQNQIHKLLKGLPPIRSLVAVGSGAAKLVSLPLKSYRKDQRIVKGMQRGTIAFLRSISREAIGLGVHLAAGAHDILLQAEYILTSTSPPSVPRPLQSRVDTNVRSNQPRDARQGFQQAFESITDGLGKSASALVQAPLKKYQRGAGVGSALATAVQAAPAAALAPASAAARAMHVALLGVRNSLDPEHKKESMNKYHGTTQSQPR